MKLIPSHVNGDIRRLCMCTICSSTRFIASAAQKMLCKSHLGRIDSVC